jgi:hypothetical protein
MDKMDGKTMDIVVENVGNDFEFPVTISFEDFSEKYV